MKGIIYIYRSKFFLTSALIKDYKAQVETIDSLSDEKSDQLRSMLNKLKASKNLYLLIFILSTCTIGMGIYGIIELKGNDKSLKIYTEQFFIITIILLVFASSLYYYLIRNVRELMVNLLESDKKNEDSKEKYWSLLEHAGDPIFVLNDDTSFSELNNSTTELLGYSNEELLGMKFSEVFPVGDLEEHPLQLDSLLKNKALLTERRWIKKDGTPLVVEINARVLEGKGYLAIARDITERKKTTELFKQQFENSPDIILIINRDLKIESINRGIPGGLTSNELIGRDCISVLPAESREISRKAVVDCFENGGNEEIENTLSNGNWVRSRFVPITFHGSIEHIMVISTDISESKKAEEEREKMTIDLIQRNKDLEQFAYIISHNLRAPVANVIGISELMQIPQSFDNEQGEMMDALKLNVKNLDNVIKDLNDILQSKREFNEKKELIKFSDLLADIKMSIFNLIQEEGVIINHDFSQVDEMVTLKSYLYSIFFNLISNAIKYKKPGHQPEIQIVSEISDQSLLFYFRDNGLGIDLSKNADQVFGLYKRFHNHVEGKGMGLFMVKTQVETLGGKISIKSETNKGSEFRIVFEL